LAFEHRSLGRQLSGEDGELQESIFCQGCGSVNPVSLHLCVYCGQRLPELPSELRLRLERLRRFDDLEKRKNPQPTINLTCGLIVSALILVVIFSLVVESAVLFGWLQL